MKTQLKTVDQISTLVQAFYQEAMSDDLIGTYFNDILETPLDKHIPIIVNFWASLILDKNSYRGNPMLKHIELNKKKKLESMHFERWLQLWISSIDELFIGENAEIAKSKAEQIASLMQMKIKRSMW